MVVNQDSNCFCTIKYLIQIYLTQSIQLQEPELALEKKMLRIYLTNTGMCNVIIIHLDLR